MIGANIRKIREVKKLGLNETARKAGISAGYLSSLERGEKKNPSMDLLQKIADALGVSVTNFFGINPYSEREKIKKNCREILQNKSSNEKERYKAALDFFRTYYDRSLEASEFSSRHTCFNDFVAMLLNNDFDRDEIPEKTYNELIKNYGKKMGIKKGSSYYDIPNINTEDNLNKQNKQSNKIDTIAAHLEGKNITPQKMKLLEKYIDALFEEDD